MGKPRKSFLITDLDNTLFDWVGLWYACFNPMLGKISEISGIPVEQLKIDIKKVHQRHGTSEYSFLIEEIASLRENFSGDLKTIFSDAIKVYQENRRLNLRLYPSVAETLLKIKGAGTKIIGYTESMAFYSKYRVRRLGLDGVLDRLFSPSDHDFPRGLSKRGVRFYSESKYKLHQTRHAHTPRGKLKPNAEILLKIIKTIGASKEECVYLGDNLMKDIAMAKDAGVSDVLAKYGQAHDSEAYELLKEVTHWTDEDVAREKEINLQPRAHPTIILESVFSEILKHFDFGNRETFYSLSQE